jgi:hypothetical protein
MQLNRYLAALKGCQVEVVQTEPAVLLNHARVHRVYQRRLQTRPRRHSDRVGRSQGDHQRGPNLLSYSECTQDTGSDSLVTAKDWSVRRKRLVASQKRGPFRRPPLGQELLNLTER